MKIKKILSVVLAATMVCGLMLTGCGNKNDVQPEPTMNIKDVEKNGIQMEDYLSIRTIGYNDYAELKFDIDFDRLKEDCSKFLVDTTSTDSFDEIFDNTYTHMLVKCENTSNLSNGDKVDIAVTIPYEINSLLTVEVHDSKLTYHVKGLEKFDGIDPFEFAAFSYVELVSVGKEVGYKLTPYARSLTILPSGIADYLTLENNIDSNKVYGKNDTVHLSVSADVIARYKDAYGEGVFKCTEIDVKVGDIAAYLPDGDDADEFFNVMDEICVDNVEYSLKKMIKSATEKDVTVEQVGMMLYFDDEGKLVQEGRDKFYNQLIFIYKVSHEDVGSWYTYMAYNGYMQIGYELNKGTIAMEKCTGDIYGSHMLDDYRYYHNEDERIYSNPAVPTSFEIDGVKYPGHKELADVFAAMKANMPVLEMYDHLIVTEALTEYVSEY